MWEEFNRKQNEEEMLRLLYYSRYMYNKSTIIVALKIVIVLINIILIWLKLDTIAISALVWVLYTVLEIFEHICVNNAAKSRNMFDSHLFEFKNLKDEKIIKEKAYNLCNKHLKKFKVQKDNLVTDDPPGLKNWYSVNNGKTKNEIILKCQMENTEWDKKITNIDLCIFVAVILFIFVITIYKYYNRTLNELISILLMAAELLYEFLKRAYFYYMHKKNISNRECLINAFSERKIQKKDIVSLQELIELRREMDLVPLNFIHRRISDYMHDLIKYLNK